MTRRQRMVDLAALEAPRFDDRRDPLASVDRRDIDDLDAWRRVVAILADLIAAPNPEDGRRR